MSATLRGKAFKLGVGAVIEGWDLAVASMKPGEVSAFTVRADYGYGWEGKPPKIPIDATLRFEIELISWKPSTKPVDEMSPMEKREHLISPGHVCCSACALVCLRFIGDSSQFGHRIYALYLAILMLGVCMKREENSVKKKR